MDNIWEGWSGEETIEGKLAEENRNIKEDDVNCEDGFSGEATVKIEKGGDGDGDNKEAGEFGGEIVGV